MEVKTGIEKWRELDGDNTLALDWPLNEYSHVWEIGGFEGRWAQQIWDKFHCNITIFEPQDWAVAKMRKRFEGIDKIEIRPYGLWTENTELLIGNFHTDGASVVKDDGREEKVTGVFRDYYVQAAKYKSKNIDLVLMNIEGAEYTLLPEFMSSGIILLFDYVFVQFHPDEQDEPHLKSLAIFQKMQETHDMLWNVYPTAVAWKRDEISSEINRIYAE